MTLTAANEVGADETDLPARVVASLVVDRPHTEALALLDATQHHIRQTAKRVQVQREATDRLVGAFILLERGLPVGRGASPTPLQFLMLQEAASLCSAVIELIGAQSPFWTFVLRALRAECLHLTGDATNAGLTARRALEAFEQLTEHDPVTDECHTLIRNLLDGREVLVTTPHFITQLATRV